MKIIDKKKKKTKRQLWWENMPGVIDLRRTNFKDGEELYKAFKGDWKKALKFLRNKG